ncbi:MAG: serine protease [Methylocella sp.]
MSHQVSFYDLEFERVPVEFKSMCGVPQIRLARVGMPHIPQNVINSVFYLYASREDAESGRDPGGTGFIVSYESADGANQFYAVTNWHVVCDGQEAYPVIRLNKNGGGIDIIDLDCSEWEFLPGKYDVAVRPINIDINIHDASVISSNLFAAPYRDKIGIGEDVFMIGLYVDHGGVTTNVPSARFGNISMLPNEQATIEQPTGYNGISYVADMHSRTGFSGSPVFVYRTFGSDLTLRDESFDSLEVVFDHLEIEPNRFGRPDSSVSGRISGSRGRIKPRHMFKFLGIHWGQFPEEWELKDGKKLKESRKGLIVDGAYVKGLSGMTCVIPSWQIMEVLDMPKLKGPRDAVFAAVKEERAGARLSRPVAESAKRSDENPNHREDFTALLNAAVRKPQSKD